MGRYVQQPFAGRCIGSQLCLTPSVRPRSAGDGDTRSALPLFTLLSHVAHRVPCVSKGRVIYQLPQQRLVFPVWI